MSTVLYVSYAYIVMMYTFHLNVYGLYFSAKEMSFKLGVGSNQLCIIFGLKTTTTVYDNH